MQGIYIYKELRNRSDEVAYYGIPLDVDQDGMLDIPGKFSDLCKTNRRLGVANKACRPMEKTFYLQVRI